MFGMPTHLDSDVDERSVGKPPFVSDTLVRHFDGKNIVVGLLKVVFYLPTLVNNCQVMHSAVSRTNNYSSLAFSPLPIYVTHAITDFIATVLMTKLLTTS